MYIIAAFVSAVVVGVAQVLGQPAVRSRVRHENGPVVQAVGAGQEPGARLRPVPGRLDDERLRRRRERRGLLPADLLHVHGGRGTRARRRGRPLAPRRTVPGVGRAAAPVADGAAGTRADDREREDGGRAHRVRQGAHTQIPVERRPRRQGRRGLVLQQRGRHTEHSSAVLLFET